MRFLLFVLVSIGCFSSCTKDKEPSNKIENLDLELNLNNLNIDFSKPIFTYSNQHEMKENSQNFFYDFRAESIEIIDKDERVTDAILSLKLSEGAVSIQSILVVNTEKEKIVESYYPNNSSGEITNRYIWVNWVAGCPSGQSQITECSNLEGEAAIADCLSTGLSDYLSQNLTGVGSCASVTVKVGVFNTVACGGDC